MENLMSDNPIVYVKESVTYYRASSLGYCPNAFVFARQGHPARIPQTMQTAFDYGIQTEPHVLDLLTKKGYEIFGMQDQVSVLLNGPRALAVIGHIDGRTDKYKGAKYPSSLIEIKCLNQANTDKFLDDPMKNFPGYMYQVSAYWVAIGPEIKHVIFAIFNKDDGKCYLHLIREPPFSREELIARVEMLEDYYERYQAEDTLLPCEGRSFCPYFYLHDQLPVDQETVEDSELAYLIKIHNLLKRKIDNLNVAKGRIDDRIKDHLADKQLTKGRILVGTDFFKFLYSEYIRRSLDTREATAYLKDTGMYGRFVKESNVRQLTISAAKDNDGEDD